VQTSKIEVKKEIARIIPTLNPNFKTREVTQKLDAKKTINVHNNRVAQYIKQTGQANFNKTKKEWHIIPQL